MALPAELAKLNFIDNNSGKCCICRQIKPIAKRARVDGKVDARGDPRFEGQVTVDVLDFCADCINAMKQKPCDLKCPAGHGLTVTIRRGFECNLCNTLFQKAVTYCCEACNYDVCEMCKKTGIKVHPNFKEIEFVEGQMDINQILEGYKNLPVFLYFHARWCQPCLILKPYLRLSCVTNGFILVSVDSDKCKTLAQAVQLKAIPTVDLYLNKAKVATFTGMDKDGLKNAIDLAKAHK